MRNDGFIPTDTGLDLEAANKFREEAAEFIRGYTQENPDITDLHMLAVMSQMVGMNMALLNRNKWHPKDAMEVISKNIQIGNKIVVDKLMDTKGNA